MLSQHTADGTLTLTLNRPTRGNALCEELVEALLEVVEALHAQGQAHTLLLRAQGPHFCTGLDLGDLERVSDGDLLLRLVRIERLLAAIWHAPIRTVAVAQGRTWGAGADLFAACDLRVATPGTRLRLPGAQFGIVLGTRRLAERIGVDRARDCVLHAREIDAATATAWGLATTMQDDGLSALRVDAHAAAAIRAATRGDHRDADLAALVRSASEPGLRARIATYRDRQRP
ncbi:MAG: enoyl-CoA hydratase/isomerase family protein [Burkholderiaceae bacterium]|nr:enoyl-CoA hydratase/isomerase family protein [Burkholderiaceae bacterium]